MSAKPILLAMVGTAMLCCASMAFAQNLNISDATRELQESWNKHPLLVVGDMHGSREIPAIVASTLESSTGRVLVALELPHDEQELVNNYIDNKVDARKALLASAFWARPLNRQDGRSSQGMLELLSTIQGMRRAGKHIDVVCIGGSEGSQAIDAAMYARLTQARGAGQFDRALVYVGNAHAAAFDAPDDQASLGTLLRSSNPLIVDISSRCGSIWACGKEGTCGVMSMEHMTCAETGGVARKSGERLGADSLLVLPAFHASPPAITTVQSIHDVGKNGHEGP
ncbi:hypothetical protein [Dyella terrae]|uniref:hypothetical protein n=1 Tax=Dyella terrae TaxID=522259 RepID=UPI001EFE2350|nr:hypothetical protein [Dyella terrae]ULU25290.1 hypothetical protein DYST_02216 [Dyella terrae]